MRGGGAGGEGYLGEEEQRDMKGNLFSSCPSPSGAWKNIAMKECHLLASPPMSPNTMYPC